MIQYPLGHLSHSRNRVTANNLVDPVDHTSLNSRTTLLFLICLCILEHIIHLLKCSAIGLGDEKPHPDQCDQTKHAEEDVGAETDALDHGRGDETDDEVVALLLVLADALEMRMRDLPSLTLLLVRIPLL